MKIASIQMSVGDETKPQKIDRAEKLLDHAKGADRLSSQRYGMSAISALIVTNQKQNPFRDLRFRGCHPFRNNTVSFSTWEALLKHGMASFTIQAF